MDDFSIPFWRDDDDDDDNVFLRAWEVAIFVVEVVGVSASFLTGVVGCCFLDTPFCEEEVEFPIGVALLLGGLDLLTAVISLRKSSTFDLGGCGTGFCWRGDVFADEWFVRSSTDKDDFWRWLIY